MLYINVYNFLRNFIYISVFIKIIKDENRNKENFGYFLIFFRDFGVNIVLMYILKLLIFWIKFLFVNGLDMCWNKIKNM